MSKIIQMKQSERERLEAEIERRRKSSIRYIEAIQDSLKKAGEDKLSLPMLFANIGYMLCDMQTLRNLQDGKGKAVRHE